MSKTVEQWEQEILDAKATDSDLNVLTDNSLVAKWRLLVGFFAQAANLLESLWQAKKEELEVIAQSTRIGTAIWYAERIKAWQYGHALVEVDGQLVYLVNDAAARLVENVAVVEGSPVRFKVAKDSGGTLVPLTLAELVSLDAYIKDIKIAGTDHELYSEDADEVLPVATCYYDGKLDFATVKTTLETALNNHLSAIYFDGKFNINKYRDAAEALTEVVDFDITGMQARPNGATYVTVTREYEALSGYFVHASGWEANITYVPT